ncbi:MAG: hypothetical protein KF696_12070 [Planctomycetes bacterium]|nr:hypothetical protein [Planctomycetota bacterium]MCW8136537.1 hypothetical protein [Planctomycetota bacterium]
MYPRLVCLLLLLAAPLCAQGMSEDYVRARTEAKFSRPHGITLEWDVMAHAAFFEQQHKVRANGFGGDGIGFARDMDGFPVGVFLDTEARLRFSWHDSIEVGYGFALTRAFKDDLGKFVRFNGVIYPPGTDIDFGADWHEVRLHYRRDLLRFGLGREFTLYATAGLEWSYVRVQTGSDTFPVSKNRDEETFKELLPWWNAGIGMQLELGTRIRLTADARGTYAIGYPTFQERDKDDMKQSVISISSHFTFEYAITDWFTLLARVKLRYFYTKLYGGWRSDRFLWYSLGPEVGFGIRL